MSTSLATCGMLARVAAAVLCIGCASPMQPQTIGPDTYRLDSRGLGERENLGWSSTGEQKMKLFEGAARYCKQQGRQAQLLDERVTPSRWSKAALAEIDFRCVAP